LDGARTVNFEPIFRWIEDLDLSIWLRESDYGFAGVVTLHTLGMAFLAGGSAMIDLRLLGLAQTSLWRGSIDLSLFCGWVSL
jgi:hypothetical protein